MMQNSKLLFLIIAVSCFFSLNAHAEKIVINLPAYTLKIFAENNLLDEFPIAIGKPANQTPIGNYHLVNKVPNPTWYKPGGKQILPPGPNNPLGSHWLGLDIAGYGLHGTIDPDSIGKAVTQGCIRLSNEDIAKLYRLVPIGTPVEIIYEPLALAVDGLDFSLQFFPDIYEKDKNIEELIVLALRKTGLKDTSVFKSLKQGVKNDPFSFFTHMPLLASLENGKRASDNGIDKLNSKGFPFSAKHLNSNFKEGSLQDWYESEQNKLVPLMSSPLLKGKEQILRFQENY